jgi:hypothetical protein
MQACSNERWLRRLGASVARAMRPALRTASPRSSSPTARSDRRGAAVGLRTMRELEGTPDRVELIGVRDMGDHKSTGRATANH